MSTRPTNRLDYRPPTRRLYSSKIGAAVHARDAFDEVLLRTDLWSAYVDESEFHQADVTLAAEAYSAPGGIVWAAVVVPPEKAWSFSLDVCNVLLHPYIEKHHVEELHFGDIYQGRKAFKNVPIRKRLEIVSAAADFIQDHQIAVYWTRFAPELPLPEQRGQGLLDALWRDRKMSALLYFLERRIANEVRRERKSAEHKVVVYVDEWRDHGDRGAGRILIGRDRDPFHGDAVFFASSHWCHPIQLADFVATSVTYALRRIETGKELFPLHEQALRVLSLQAEGEAVRFLIDSDDGDRRRARRLAPGERIPPGAEPFAWDKSGRCVRPIDAE